MSQSHSYNSIHMALRLPKESNLMESFGEVGVLRDKRVFPHGEGAEFAKNRSHDTPLMTSLGLYSLLERNSRMRATTLLICASGERGCEAGGLSREEFSTCSSRKELLL